MELTIDDLRQLITVPKEPRKEPEGPWQIGKWYLIRTVTMIDCGRLASVSDKELVLEDATWIADTGRFSDCLQDPGTINEAEPYKNDCIVGRGAIIDATEWHSCKVSRK